MARIEELLTDIDDPALKRALEKEVAQLKQRKQFGLVFERHLPESVLLDRFVGVRVGDSVELRNEPQNKERFRVTQLDNEHAVIADSEGATRAVEFDDLLVAKNFGDPIYPTLTALDSLHRAEGKDPHLVVNGENFHALQMLAYTHEGQADCIYIDPPYNTEATDWQYNNDYVDNNDRYRHSKWLSFMEKRLRLSKRLLKTDGVLIVTIDEHEVSHLGVLLEEVFPDYLRYLVTIVINPKGTAKVNFGRTGEYAYFIVPDTGKDVIAFLPPPTEQPDAQLTVEASNQEEDEAGVWERRIDQDGAVRLPRALLDRLGADAATPLEISVREDGVVEIQSQPDEADDGAADDDVGVRGVTQQDNYSVLHLRRRGQESSAREDRWRQFYGIKVNEKTRQVEGIGPLLELTDPYDLGKREEIASGSIRSTAKATSASGATAATR